MGEVLSGGAALFFNSAICVSSPKLSPNLPARAENGSDSLGSDCHSQRLGPLLRGRTERFGGGQIVSICKRLWGESLQCQMVRIGVSLSIWGLA